MVNAHSLPDQAFPNQAVSSQRVIAALGRLQAMVCSLSSHCSDSASTDASASADAQSYTQLESIYIYDLVEQSTICTSLSIAALLGYSTEQIDALGTLGLATLIHPADLSAVSDHFQRFATLRAGEVIALEYRMKQADGGWCWLRSQDTVLVQASDGLPLQVLGLVRPIMPVSATKHSVTDHNVTHHNVTHHNVTHHNVTHHNVTHQLATSRTGQRLLIDRRMGISAARRQRLRLRTEQFKTKPLKCELPKANTV